MSGRKEKCYKGKVFVCPSNCCLMSLSTPERKSFIIKTDLFAKVKDSCLKGLWSPAPVSLNCINYLSPFIIRAKDSQVFHIQHTRNLLISG